jgi:hypothetical protein
MSIESLLKCSSQLGVSPVSFLTNLAGDVVKIPPEPAVALALGRRPRQQPSERKPFHLAGARQVLKATLKRKKPPSLYAVARRLGCTPSILQKKLPELSRAISARYLEYRKAQGQRTRERLIAEVREVTLQLHEGGQYPSQPKVMSRLRQPGSIRNLEVHRTWRETLRELGYVR